MIIASYSPQEDSSMFFMGHTAEDSREDLIYWIDWYGNYIVDWYGNYMVFWN